MLGIVRRVVLSGVTALFAGSLAAPALALTPLPPSCTENDGRVVGAIWGQDRETGRASISGFSGKEGFSAVVDCVGGLTLFYRGEEDARVWDKYDANPKMNLRRLARLLERGGAETELYKAKTDSCVCEFLQE